MSTRRDLSKPYKCLTSKCPGVLKDPIEAYGKWAYWHGDLGLQGPAPYMSGKPNSGWWAKPAVGQKA